MKEFIKNILDRPEKKYKRVTKRASRIKSLLWFIGALLILFILIFFVGFKLDLVYLTVFAFDLLTLVFTGINLFTKKGILLYDYVEDSDDSE